MKTLAVDIYSGGGGGGEGSRGGGDRIHTCLCTIRLDQSPVLENQVCISLETIGKGNPLLYTSP